jgi:hypothetical protein
MQNIDTLIANIKTKWFKFSINFSNYLVYFRSDTLKYILIQRRKLWSDINILCLLQLLHQFFIIQHPIWIFFESIDVIKNSLLDFFNNSLFFKLIKKEYSSLNACFFTTLKIKTFCSLNLFKIDMQCIVISCNFSIWN